MSGNDESTNNTLVSVDAYLIIRAKERIREANNGHLIMSVYNTPVEDE
jgi:hypothetical protein